MNKNPIGIFDSGVGGLSVVKEIVKVLPNENIIYFGDTARVPYGTKSKRIIRKFALENVNFLLKFNPKLIIIACHTVSAYASSYLKKKIKSVKFIDVIEPTVEKVVKLKKNKKIGVIGTTATISSMRYQKLFSKHNGLTVYTKDCPLFVPIVEEGWFENEVSYKIAEIYLNKFKKKKIDTLVLGCTHYPYLKKTIKKIIGKNVNIVDASYEVSIKTKKILEENGLENKNGKGEIKLYFSDISPYIERTIKILFGKKVKYKLTKNV
ncbi:MAG: glutamate racemase [Candidatus Omnitrophica bacterium]|nr:glutamate racemase [Candidatus Omnitrophota bacterium]MCM8801949.1 glutamate racemase [Candidatus Omnitrophota bacterium]